MEEKEKQKATYDEMFSDEEEVPVTSLGTTLVEEKKKDIIRLAVYLNIIKENTEKALVIIEKLKE